MIEKLIGVTKKWSLVLTSLYKKKRDFRKLTSLVAGLKVIPENVHIHPMEGQWKVSNFSKYEAKLELLGGFIFWWKDEG